MQRKMGEAGENREGNLSVRKSLLVSSDQGLWRWNFLEQGGHNRREGITWPFRYLSRDEPFAAFPPLLLLYLILIPDRPRRYATRLGDPGERHNILERDREHTRNQEAPRRIYMRLSASILSEARSVTLNLSLLLYSQASVTNWWAFEV